MENNKQNKTNGLVEGIDDKLTGHYMLPYGKYYDFVKERTPKKDEDYDLIVHIRPQDDDASTISSLEGIFVAPEESPIGETIPSMGILKRSQMKDFEKKYNGKFIPFRERDYPFGNAPFRKGGETK